ncbi:MAG TPA: serine hydrolase [Anaeromyxobacter sp.]|nr:serine hydrolase [Anaeromyxobacter sp.]
MPGRPRRYRVRAGDLRLLLLGSLWAALACGPRHRPLDQAFAEAGRLPNVLSLAISRDGAPVREQYFHGAGPADPQDVRSVTKSVVALLVGTALDQGCLSSLDETLGDALGSLAPEDPDKAAISLRDLLTMSSGLAWSEVGADGYDQWAVAPDQVAYVLARDLVEPPGSTFDYDSGAFHLLSVAITLACAPTADFATAHLLGPLGIRSRAWETDDQGFTNGAAGLELTTREMLAVGNLVLDAGAAGGAQLVPAAFVEAATRRQIATGPDAAEVAPGYGYGWWVGTTSTGQAYALAEGYGGQLIVVVPSSRAVVAATARWQGVDPEVASSQFYELLRIIDEDVIPAL